jgi:hypothetical protein
MTPAPSINEREQKDRFAAISPKSVSVLVMGGGIRLCKNPHCAQQHKKRGRHAGGHIDGLGVKQGLISGEDPPLSLGCVGQTLMGCDAKWILYLGA